MTLQASKNRHVLAMALYSRTFCSFYNIVWFCNVAGVREPPRHGEGVVLTDVRVAGGRHQQVHQPWTAPDPLHRHPRHLRLRKLRCESILKLALSLLPPPPHPHSTPKPPCFVYWVGWLVLCLSVTLFMFFYFVFIDRQACQVILRDKIIQFTVFLCFFFYIEIQPFNKLEPILHPLRGNSGCFRRGKRTDTGSALETANDKLLVLSVCIV